MNPRIYGGAAPKVLLLLVCIVLLIGFFQFQSQYGRTGHVKPLPLSTQGRIAFVRSDSGQSDLFLIGADGADLRQLTEGKGSKRGPTWAPEGDRLCYAAEPETTGAERRSYQLF